MVLNIFSQHTIRALLLTCVGVALFADAYAQNAPAPNAAAPVAQQPSENTLRDPATPPVASNLPADPAMTAVMADPATAPVENTLPVMVDQTAAPAQTMPPVAPAPSAAQAPGPAAPSALDTYLKADDARQAQEQQNALPTSVSVKVRGEGFALGGEKMVSLSTDDENNPITQAEMIEGIRSEAYDAALTGLFPLKPDEIEGLLKHYDETERAAQSPPYAQPTPEISVQNISMDPGVVPPIIKTAVGNVTTVNILDMTGAPWPVQDITWAGDFEIIEPEEGGHIIRITPMTKFAFGNMSVRLLTLKTPITFTIRAERDTVHYRVDARIPEYGPFAQPQLLDGGTELVAGSALLTSILDGVTPTGAERLDVSGVDGRTSAYKVGGNTYVRTPLTLLSPGWESSVSSADGMNVYALKDTPVLLLSDQGKFQRAKLQEKEGLLDE